MALAPANSTEEIHTPLMAAACVIILGHLKPASTAQVKHLVVIPLCSCDVNVL